MISASNISRIAVIGSSSMVGSRFCELWDKPANLITADLNGSPAVDITDNTSVSNLFNSYDFSVCILFSAFTGVDEAEKQRDDKNGLCWKINVDGVKNIAQNCRQKNIKLIFISTDFVFDGEFGPYGEDDAVGENLEKTSWYGITKIEGEKIVAANLQDYLILRIAYPYRANFPAKDDLLRKTLKAYRDGDLYPMFNDQMITPTFIDDVAKGVKLLLEKDQKGIFHLASPAVVTPYELAKKLVKAFGGDPSKVKRGSIKEFLKTGNKTPRPTKGGLKVDKIIKLGFTPTGWELGINEIYKQIEK